MAYAARNPLLAALLRHFSGACCRAVWQRDWDRTYRRVGVEDIARVHSGQHANVMEAIAAGDARAAHRAMPRHLEAVSIDMGYLAPAAPATGGK
ncbi:FCD domain-containing protein [Roseitranquillus sediminis]|uniref:FCD domain-containing protein n=1 Tax=Roseitranquillus sediminis TaxID=2809051 RepID=UPI001D0C3632|nr:FCD domain-containing protein [Roseitranquillus sediminis]